MSSPNNTLTAGYKLIAALELKKNQYIFLSGKFTAEIVQNFQIFKYQPWHFDITMETCKHIPERNAIESMF